MAGTKRVFKSRGSRRGKDTLGKRIRQVVQNIAETKSIEYYGAADATQTWQFYSFIAGSPILQGTDIVNRIGDKIKLKRIDVVVKIAPYSGTTGVPQAGSNCRVVIYHNKKCGGAIPTPAQMWNLSAAGSSDIMATRNEAFVKRLSILKDFSHSMVVTASVTAGTDIGVGPIMLAKFSIYPKASVGYGNTGGVIASMIDNDYGIAYVGDGNACCNVRFTAKTVWTDE